MKTKGGRKVLQARRLKGRHSLAYQPSRAKRVDWKAG
jgi:ribosomal protein L34